MRARRQRPTVFPWLMIGAGAFVFWTIALGIGIPSLGRVLGTPGPARWQVAQKNDVRCVSTATVDGRPVSFGDCINVRFLLDAPELGRPAFTVPREPDSARYVPGADREIGSDGSDVRFDVVAPPALDSVGRTAY